jgi:DNA-binding transcriptional MerR regulator
MAEQTYTIQDLSDQTGTTIRNIRYYTDQGLLPKPTLKGRQAYYTLEHLDRLNLINRLRRRHFPLDEIRPILYNLDAEGVQRLLQYQDSYLNANNLHAFKTEKPNKSVRDLSPINYSESTGPSKKVEEDSKKALEYIDSLLGNKPSPPVSGRQAPADPLMVKSFMPANPSSTTGKGEAWERIPLGPGVELHLRQPANPDDAQKIQELVDIANKIFSKRKRGG